MSARYGAGKFGSQSLTALGRDPLLGFLEFNVRLREIENAAGGIIQRGGEIGTELALEYNPHSPCVESVTTIRKSARVDIGQQESAGSCNRPGADQCRVCHAIAEYGHLHTVVADVPRNAELLVVRAFQAGGKVSHADARIGLAQIRRC